MPNISPFEHFEESGLQRQHVLNTFHAITLYYGKGGQVWVSEDKAPVPTEPEDVLAQGPIFSPIMGLMVFFMASSPLLSWA